MHRIIVPLVLLLALAGSAFGQMVPQTKTVVHDLETQTIAMGLSKDVKYYPNEGIRLAGSKKDGYSRKGILTSPKERSPLPFNNLVYSWNFDLPEGTGALIEVRATDGKGGATAWYEMARVGKTSLPLERIKKDANGHIEDDTLVLNKNWDYAEYRVTLYTVLSHRTPTLRLMAICYADAQHMVPYVATPIPTEKQPWMRSIPVKWRSQIWEVDSLSGLCCGPTSLSMAMAYHGVDLSTEEVASQDIDDYGDMYGNWPFLAQTASRNGFKAWVMRCQDFKPIEAEIAAGRPVIITIKYGKGEIDGIPPSWSTAGHIILCVGFTDQGDLIINDPGSSNKSFDHIVYKRSQIAKAMLDTGVAICVIPRDKK